jgi:hypothetical protein
MGYLTMTPKDFEGSYILAEGLNGWWIGYREPYDPNNKENRMCIYYYRGGWHDNMSDGGDYKKNYFSTKEAALEVFFNDLPGQEILDLSTEKTLKKIETWRDRPPLL